jgi:DTW domain-containing protein YfiP
MCNSFDQYCASCSWWLGQSRCDQCAKGYYLDNTGKCQRCLFEFQNCEICSIGPDFRAYCQICLPGFITNLGRCLVLSTLSSSILTFASTLLVLLATLFMSFI